MWFTDHLRVLSVQDEYYLCVDIQELSLSWYNTVLGTLVATTGMYVEDSEEYANV